MKDKTESVITIIGFSEAHPEDPSLGNRLLSLEGSVNVWCHPTLCVVHAGSWCYCCWLPFGQVGCSPGKPMKRYREISDSSDETLWDPDVPISALTMFNYRVLWGQRVRTGKIDRERRRCGFILTQTAKMKQAPGKVCHLCSLCENVCMHVYLTEWHYLGILHCYVTCSNRKRSMLCGKNFGKCRIKRFLAIIWKKQYCGKKADKSHMNIRNHKINK